MSKKVIVANLSERGETRVLPKIEGYIKDNNSVMVVSKEPPFLLINKGITYKQFDDYLDENDIERIEKDVLQFMHELPRKSSRFSEAVTYNGVSLWDVQAFAIFNFLFTTFKFIKATQKLIRVEEPDKLIIVGNSSSFLFWHNIEQAFCERTLLSKVARWVANSKRSTTEQALVYEVAKSKGIPARRMPIGAGAHLRHHLVGFLLPPLFRSFLGFSDWRRRNSESNTNEAKAMVSLGNKICFVVGSGNVTQTAVPVIRELESDGCNDVLIIKVDSPMNNSTREALKRETTHYVTYETYQDSKVRKKVGRGIRSLWQKWNGLKRERQFQELICYEGIDIWPVLKDNFSLIFSMMLTEAIKHVESIINLCDKEDPDIFVLTNELSPPERAAALIARIKGIPTLDVQSMAYGVKEPPIQITTDKMAIGGELIKQLAIQRKGEVYEDRLVIVGHPAIDFMLQKLDSFNREEFNKELGLKTDRSIVLFTSQSVQLPVTPEIREQLVRCVYKAIKELPEEQFIVKLHPGEGFELHYKLQREMKLTNVVIVKDVNLYYLFKICNLVMSFLSTTGLEAMIMDKPVIEINLTGKPDILPYVQSGAALSVHRENDLLPTIRSALYNEEVREILATKRKAFIYNYAYLVDGQAARRIRDLIIQMIKESRKRI
ncbi:hypothetical protein ACFLU4_04420 [Chloroflexota bacterium]